MEWEHSPLRAHEQERAELAKQQKEILAEERRAQRQKAANDVNARPPIPKDVQMFVWQRDGGRCVECGSNEHLEFDHIIPFAKGGSSTTRNVQLLCEPCNRRKGMSVG